MIAGVYFRDLLHDMPFVHLREYTINYYHAVSGVGPVSLAALLPLFGRIGDEHVRTLSSCRKRWLGCSL